MTSGSYEAYWIDWVHEMDAAGPVNYPLFSFIGQARFSLLIMIICIVVLKMYGFSFWLKY